MSFKDVYDTKAGMQNSELPRQQLTFLNAHFYLLHICINSMILFYLFMVGSIGLFYCIYLLKEIDILSINY